MRASDPARRDGAEGPTEEYRHAVGGIDDAVIAAERGFGVCEILREILRDTHSIDSIEHSCIGEKSMGRKNASKRLGDGFR